MNETNSWPSQEELKKLPILKSNEVMDYFKKQRLAGNDSPRVLVDSAGFLDLLEALGKFRIKPKLLEAYCSPKLHLLPPPVRREDAPGKNFYVFPDHLEEANVVLSLRFSYHLPLEAIRAILERFPVDDQHLIMNRKFSLEELLDMAKMLPRGFEVKDFVMARASDDMIQDLLPPGKAMEAAMKPGDELYELEEKLVLQRLEEAKTWVQSGRMREYLNRESAEDIRNLAQNQLIIKKITGKLKAKAVRNGAKLKALSGE